MAQRGIQMDKEKLCCSICLDLLKDPVTISCGHNYCMSCIRGHWDEEDQKRIDSCPQCRQTFGPRPSLQENICTSHNEAMKIFCRTDQQCICYLCSMDEHKGHDTVSAAAEMTEKQKELGASRQKIQQSIQKREKDVKVLQQEVDAINRSADKAVKNSEKIFTDLIRLIEKRISDVKQQVRSQQKSKVSRVKELQEKLQQEITDLRKRDTELEQLSHTEDHTQFLQNYPSLSNLAVSSSINIRPVRHFEDVTAAVSEVRDKLENILTEAWTKISLTGTEVDILLPQAEPKTRADFLQYSCQITLEPNRENTVLSLSEGNRKAGVRRASALEILVLSNSFHLDRPGSQSEIDRLQVLSRESLTGRHYWEVECSGDAVSVAVTYGHMKRAVYESGYGNNDKSWAVHYSGNGYELRHNNISTLILGPWSSRVGVYLDHSAGILCFYKVSETMTLLHRVQTTFTQPLYVGLFVGVGSTAELK